MLAICICLTCACIACDSSASSTNTSLTEFEEFQNENVLVLFSYDNAFPYYSQFMSSFIEHLYEGTEPTAMYIDSMDLTRVTNENDEYLSAIRDLYRTKYATIQPAVAVLVDKPALDLFLSLYEEIPLTSQIIYFGNIPDDGTDIPDFVIRYDSVDTLKGTIQLALDQNPDAKHAVLVAGIGIVDQINLLHAEAAFHTLAPSLEIETLDTLSWSDVEKRVSELPNDSFIISLPLLEDIDGNIRSLQSSTSALHSVSSVPIYTPYDTAIGYGAIGGYTLKSREIGILVSDDILSFLSQENKPNQEEIKRKTSERSVNLFDWNEMKRFHLSSESLPPDAEIIHMPPDPFEEYGNYIFAIILITTFMIIFIIALLLNQEKLKDTQSSLYEALDTLKMRDEQLMLALENANEGLWEWDMVTDLISVNPEWTVQYPYLSSTQSSKKWIKHVHPDDQELFSPKQILESTQSSGQYIFRMMNASKEWRWLAIKGKSYSKTEEVQRDISGTITDITNIQKYEQILLETNKKLNILSQITRHDVLNQLMVLTSIQDMMYETEKSAEELELLELNGQALATITSQIMFARDYHELGENGAKWQEISSIVKNVNELLIHPPIKLKVGELPEIYADSLFEKVVYNLIENALRHGGEQLSCISVTFHQTKHNGILIFKDNGIGVPKDQKKRIFDQGIGSHTGLGLFMVREILNITNISIRECGIYGSGSKFEIIIPNYYWREKKQA